MPFSGREARAAVVVERRLVVGSQEVANGQSLVVPLVLKRRNHPVDGRVESLPGQEPQRVADVDDGVARSRHDSAPAARARGQDFQAGVFAEQQRQGAVVRVLVLAEPRAGLVEAPWVAEQVEAAIRLLLVSVTVCEASFPRQVQGVRQGGQDVRGDGARPSDKVEEQLAVLLVHVREHRRILGHCRLGDLQRTMSASNQQGSICRRLALMVSLPSRVFWNTPA